jgi:uncharacterized membrane protein
VRFARAAFLGFLVLGSIAITLGSVAYFIEGDVHPFVLEKGAVPLKQVWMLALRVHVLAAAWCLPACAALFSKWLLRKSPRTHRWLGRVTCVVILFALVPSGAWLAFTARGGVPSTLGFLLSGAIVAVATVTGVLRARAGDVAAHRRATAQVLGQLSVAVTSRALLVVFDAAGFDPVPAYVVALWVPVLASAWLAHRLLEGRRDHETAVPSRLLFGPGC